MTCTDCLHLLWLWAVLVLSACSRSAPPPTPAPLPFCGDLCSHPTCLKERCYCFDNWKPTTGTLAWQVGSGRECEVPR